MEDPLLPHQIRQQVIYSLALPLYSYTNKPYLEYAKYMLVLTDFGLLEQLWASESNNKYCSANKVRHTEPNRLGCQRLCEQNANCVGISYTNSGSYTDICYVCLSDTLTSDTYGFNFYRRPGIVL